MDTYPAKQIIAPKTFSDILPQEFSCQNLTKISQTEALILSKMEQLMSKAILLLYPEEEGDNIRNFWILKYIREHCDPEERGDIFVHAEILDTFNKGFEILYDELHQYLRADITKKNNQGKSVDVLHLLKAISNLSDIELLYAIKKDFDQRASQPQPSRLRSFVLDFLSIVLPIGTTLGLEKISGQITCFFKGRLSDTSAVLAGLFPDFLLILLEIGRSWNAAGAKAAMYMNMNILTTIGIKCLELLSFFFAPVFKHDIDRDISFLHLLTHEVSLGNIALYTDTLNLFWNKKILIKKYLTYAGLLVIDKKKRTKEFLVGILFDLINSVVRRSLSSFIKNRSFNVTISEQTIKVRDCCSSDGGAYFIPEQTVSMKGSDVEKCLCNSTLLDKDPYGKGILTFFMRPFISIVEKPLLTTFWHLSMDQKKKFLENGASCYSDVALTYCRVSEILCFFGFFCSKFIISKIKGIKFG